MPNIINAETPKDMPGAVGGEGTVQMAETARTRMDGRVALGWPGRHKASSATPTGMKCPLGGFGVCHH